ncbi:hypothetical protein [Microaerobacter geothermalis]|nr:hypothetical protein [Microaerobacter geothermalis]
MNQKSISHEIKDLIKEKVDQIENLSEAETEDLIRMLRKMRGH